MFSLDVQKVQRLCDFVNFDPNKRQNVILINEKKVVGESNSTRNQTKEKFVFDEHARP
jgi:hypothetical protein